MTCVSCWCSLLPLPFWLHEDVPSWEGYNTVAESIVGAKERLQPLQCERKMSE